MASSILDKYLNIPKGSTTKVYQQVSQNVFFGQAKKIAKIAFGEQLPAKNNPEEDNDTW